MVVIAFPNGNEWCKANWAFRQLAADVATRYPDRDLRECLERAEAVGLLDIRNMDQVRSAKLTAALRDIAHDTVEGTLAGWRPEDHAGAQMYRDAMAELLAAIGVS